MTILEIGVAMMLISMKEDVNYLKFTNAKIGKVFQLFGQNSYEIYLTHSMIIIGIVGISAVSALANLWIVCCYIGILGCSLYSGILISKYYSQYMNHLLRRVKFRTIATNQLKNVTE